jgi:hypothetical protein
MQNIGSVLSKGVTRGAKGSNKMVYMIIAITTFAVALVGAVIKAIWFKVPYLHTYVMMHNGEVKLNKNGDPIVKESGWRCQMPIRDDHVDVNCTEMTSLLSPQSLQAGDGKNDVGLSIRYHVLSFRDGSKFRHHPVRTLQVDNLNQAVEEAVRDAVRQVMATSNTPASQWESKKLFRAVNKLVKKELEAMGVRLDRIMVPSASRSEAQTLGGLVKESVVELRSAITASEPETEEALAEPSIHAVPS